MDFRTLETFVWIARLGSFRAAAQRLYASQPSVSSRIANLERTLGVSLFDRAGRRVTLTARGRDMLAYAEQLLALRSEMLNAVADPSAIQGSIRLGVVETIVYTWLPRLIERVNEAYPALSLELDVDTSVNLAEKLTAHDLDIAFLMGPVNQPDITSRTLSRYPLEWVASPALALPDEPVSLEELARWPIITYPRLSQPHLALQRLLGQAGARMRIHASSSLATIIRMTVDGIGVSALPPEIIAAEIERGALRRFRAEVQPPPLLFHVCHANTPEFTVARAVADLAVRIAADPAPDRES
ncbi:HTH-type transcriptional activator CmpR [wastewater metagenome]|uniref:HTH-type transcriptional activator CmpR n=2 Tax=unclassified sequences TaxID=12908 RepID=A0A5B8R8F5_9ZZZZ|nr:LysR family transcriptional regulator [Arhodomonas aquaeolei]MCS4504281.1 LysR family transcriptional regulator [Arhodomonas aquaeolei]QEA04791.1 HTH-type transcriptional activator CmpR [uncultured organism]